MGNEEKDVFEGQQIEVDLYDEEARIKQRIEDLKIEKSMGEIIGELDTEDMIGNAEREIEELEKKLVEVEKAIETKNRIHEKKYELGKKYPNQKWYHRVLTMCDEELKNYEDYALSPVRQKIADYTAEKEKLETRKNELEKRIYDIKEEIKNTHSADLLEEAKTIMEEYKKLQQHLENVSNSLKELGPGEIDLEEFRQRMINKLDGYTKPGNPTVIEYIEEQQKEGKSLEEIANEINNCSNIELEETYGYIEMAERISNFTIDGYKDDAQVKKDCNELMQYLMTVIDDSRTDEDLSKQCENAMKKLVEYMENTLSIRKKIYAKNAIDMLKTELTYRIIDKYAIPTTVLEGLPTSKNTVLRTIEDYDEGYHRLAEASDRGDPTMKREDISPLAEDKSMKMKKVNEVLSYVLSKLPKDKNNIQIINELKKYSSSKPGKYTAEDIENYLILQEFIKEQEEEAKIESQQFVEQKNQIQTEELTDPYAKLNKMLEGIVTESELNKMLDEEKAPEENEDNKVY